MIDPSSPSCSTTQPLSQAQAQPSSADILIFGTAHPRLVASVTHAGPHARRTDLKWPPLDHQYTAAPADIGCELDTHVEHDFIQGYFVDDPGVGSYPADYPSGLSGWQHAMGSPSWSEEPVRSAPASPLLPPSPLFSSSREASHALSEPPPARTRRESSEVRIIEVRTGTARPRYARQLDNEDYDLLGSMKANHPYAAAPAHEQAKFPREYREAYDSRIRKLDHFVAVGLVTLDRTIAPDCGGAYLIAPAGEAAVALKKTEDAAAAYAVRARRRLPRS